VFRVHTDFVPETPQTLAEAQELISRLEQELASLRGRMLLLRSSAGSSDALTQLLEAIVETAATVLHARSASLLLIDDARQDMLFRVALGPKGPEVQALRIPLGHGIAGLVAVSGQALATANARTDPRQAADIAQRIGYYPDTIACAPVFDAQRVVGVLEVLDKEDAPSFSATDVETLGRFAKQAGTAIGLFKTQEGMATLVSQLDGGSSGQRRGGPSRTVPADEQRVFDLARLVYQISQQGPEAADACLAVLRAFAQFLHTKPDRQTEPSMEQIFGAAPHLSHG
jgi:GAF domain-containing protein